MRLSKFFITMFILTTLSLVYIHLQVQICDLGYKGQRKEMQLQKLNEDNDNVRHNICILKSANHLGVKLLKGNSGLQFLDTNSIVKLTDEKPFVDEHRAVSKGTTKKQNFFTKLFSLKSQAEAVPIR